MMRARTPKHLGWRWLTAVVVAIAVVTGIVVSESAKAQNHVAVRDVSSKTALQKYAHDLTAAAEQGRFDSLTERQDEANRALQVLARNHKNNPVVLTESQAVRDLVAAGVARKIAQGDVPEELLKKRVFKLDLESLFRDSKTAEDLKNSVAAILSDIAKSDSKIILLIDPIQSLMGASSAFDGAASALLRDAIRDGDVQCLGASTDIAFVQIVASDESLAPLFVIVATDEEVAGAEAQQNEDSANPADSSKASAEEFVGDKVSDDLRALISSDHPPTRVQAILQVDNTNSAVLQAQLARYRVKIIGQMPQFGAIAIDAPAKTIEKLAANSKTRYLSLDRQVTSMGHIENTTGETAMWAQSGNSGFDGSGIGIAILDSGIAPKIGGLDGIAFNQDFTGEGITNDPFGHGTFVAAMAAANKGSYGGIAPAAKLVNFRVLNSQGLGTTSGVLSALNAVVTYRSKYNIRVVNMSLGMPAIDSYKNDPICRAVRSLVNLGIVVVAAAGNDGKDASNAKMYGRIHSPGNEPSAITVGAVNTYGTDVRSDDGIATYSSRGPTRSYWTDTVGVKHYDNLIKPDLAAPGNKIIGDASPSNRLLTSNPGLGMPGKTNVMRMSGTSVASPVVSGTAALLLEANPSLTPNLIKMILMYTAQPLAGFNMLEQGAGELNIEGAIRLAKLVRKDLSSSTQVGASLLTSSAPTPQTTIAGQTFEWAKGVLFQYDWANGSDLITKYQAIYDLGVLLGDGVLLTDGVLLGDTTMLSSGVLLGDNIMISSGITMSDGTVLMTNGVLLGDGVLITDGTLLSDGTIVSDGTVVSDSAINGDNTICMSLE